MKIRSSVAAASPPPQLIEQLQLALKHHQGGDFALADNAYKKAVKDFPEFPDALHMAAIFYVQIGKNAFAISLLNKILKKKTDDYKIHLLLAKAYLADDTEKAYAAIKLAYGLNPNDPETTALYGDLLLKRAQIAEAKDIYFKAMRQKANAQNYNRLGHILLIQNEMKDLVQLVENAYKNQTFDYDTLLLLALGYGLGTIKSYNMLIKALHFDPARDEAKVLFSLTLFFGQPPIDISPSLAECVRFCLDSERVNHSNLGRLWFNQLFENPENAREQELLRCQDYNGFAALFEQAEYRKSLLTPYFIDGIKKITLSINSLELLLKHMRHFYLERLHQKTLNLETHDIDFLSALAIQCFYSEYVISISPAEQNMLGDIIHRLDDPKHNNLENILICACYQALATLPKHKDLKNKSFAAEKAFKNVAAHQIDEYLEQQTLKKSIRKLSSISDDVSQSVQQQYEENPYPRWRNENFVYPLAHLLIDETYQKKANVLIAGCGTGKHIIHVHTRNPYHSITALDLSSSSLAYAMMKCKNYGMKNVKFYQGDILNLDQLDDIFDEVECMGVLHHMKNPEAGLQSLLTKLKTGGKLALGLYSESARQGVIAVRQAIQEQGFPATPEGIRACREYVKADQTNPHLTLLKQSPDFFSLSGCRDLVFHVQEIRYTIPEIKDLLERNGLRFKEFILPDVRLHHYKEHFPDDPLCQNLDNWHKFENLFPNFFGGMYQFICVKS
jgi:ubiquinone/menaquinone biosynthesis C-methylase UbiE